MEAPKTPKSNKETVLILCAHPDDEILGLGGTIAKYVEEGKEVIAVIYSYGEQGNWWLKKEYTQDLRMKESHKAGEVVGISGEIFLGLKDLSLKQELEKPEVYNDIIKLIKEHNPKRIFTHSEDDVVYADHKAVHDSTIKILREIDFKGDLYTFNIWGKNLRATEKPKLYVDISDTFKLKIKALNEFKSQKLLVMTQLLPGVYIDAIKYGLQNKCKFAECFLKESFKENE